MMDFEHFLSNTPFHETSFLTCSIDWSYSLDGSDHKATHVTETTWTNESRNSVDSAMETLPIDSIDSLFEETYVTTATRTKESWNSVDSAMGAVPIDLFEGLFEDQEVNSSTQSHILTDNSGNISYGIEDSFPFTYDFFVDDCLFGDGRVDTTYVPGNNRNSSILGNFKTSYLSDEKEKAASSGNSVASGKIRKSSKFRRNRTSTNIIKWLYDLLCKGDPCIRWLDQEELKLLIVDQHRLATLWGIHKGNTKMNYNKFARTLRYHYERSKYKELVDISKKCKHKKKLVYQISPNAPFLRKDKTKHHN